MKFLDALFGLMRPAEAPSYDWPAVRVRATATALARIHAEDRDREARMKAYQAGWSTRWKQLPVNVQPGPRSWWSQA